MWIHDILEHLRTGTVLYDSGSCLPANVIVSHIPATKPTPVWGFYRTLATPILEKVEATQWVFGMRMLPVSNTKEYHHI